MHPLDRPQSADAVLKLLEILEQHDGRMSYKTLQLKWSRRKALLLPGACVAAPFRQPVAGEQVGSRDWKHLMRRRSLSREMLTAEKGVPASPHLNVTGRIAWGQS